VAWNVEIPFGLPDPVDALLDANFHMFWVVWRWRVLGLEEVSKQFSEMISTESYGVYAQNRGMR